jgi:hypothetical protein
VNEQVEMLLYRKPPKTVRHALFEHRMIEDATDSKEREARVLKIEKKVEEFQRILAKHGTGKEWLLADIPERDVVFTRPLSHIVKRRKSENLYLERDPVKVVSKHGKPSLLVERENTLMRLLSGYVNFVPSVYANEPAYQLLKARGLLEDRG